MNQEFAKLQTEAGMLFARASGKYPASVAAQGSFIALELDLDQKRVRKAKRELLSNSSEIDLIFTIAEKRHLLIPEDRRPVISLKKMKRIMREDFDFALRVTILPPDVIDRFLRVDFEYFIAQNKGDALNLMIGEASFEQKVLRTIELHKRMRS
jgi:hypothetical protein